jgi:hypothetical protein
MINQEQVQEQVQVQPAVYQDTKEAPQVDTEDKLI